MKKSILNKILTALCLVCGVLAISSTNVKAEYIYDGVVSYSNNNSISVGYVPVWGDSSTKQGVGGYTSVYLNNSSCSIANVKSSDSTRLQAKITQKDKYSYKASWGSNTYINEWYIGYFAKKAGNYKVTFDVLDENGAKLNTYTIDVYAYGSSVSVYPIKSIKYAGKEIWTYEPFTNKKKGKLSVKTKSGYTVTKIIVSTPDKKGDWIDKEVKNNANIKLATSNKYTTKSSTSTHYNNSLFPETRIKIEVQNNKTKECTYYYEYLYTINRK